MEITHLDPSLHSTIHELLEETMGWTGASATYTVAPMLLPGLKREPRPGYSLILTITPEQGDPIHAVINFDYGVVLDVKAFEKELNARLTEIRDTHITPDVESDSEAKAESVEV